MKFAQYYLLYRNSYKKQAIQLRYEVRAKECVFERGRENLLMQFEIFYATVPRCEEYFVGDALEVIGSPDVESDRKVSGKFRLNIQSIEKIQGESGSGLYGIFTFFDAIRRFFIDLRQRALLFLPTGQAELLTGMVFGGSQSISNDLQVGIQQLGLQHIVSASGYNVAILVEYAKKILEKFFSRQAANLLLGCLLAGYLFICGLTPSLLRAVFMQFGALLASAALFRQRSAILWLVFSSGGLLFLNPLFLTDLSFQLTIAATLGILLYTPLLSIKNKQSSDITANTSYDLFELIKQAFFTTFCAQIFVFSILLYHFGQLTLFSLISNTVLLWLTPWMTLCGFAFFTSLIFSPFLASIFSFLSWFPSTLFIRGVERLAQVDASIFQVRFQFSLMHLIASWIVIFCMYFFLKRKNKAYESQYLPLSV